MHQHGVDRPTKYSAEAGRKLAGGVRPSPRVRAAGPRRLLHRVAVQASLAQHPAQRAPWPCDTQEAPHPPARKWTDMRTRKRATEQERSTEQLGRPVDCRGGNAVAVAVAAADPSDADLQRESSAQEPGSAATPGRGSGCQVIGGGAGRAGGEERRSCGPGLHSHLFGDTRRKQHLPCCPNLQTPCQSACLPTHAAHPTARTQVPGCKAQLTTAYLIRRARQAAPAGCALGAQSSSRHAAGAGWRRQRPGSMHSLTSPPPLRLLPQVSHLPGARRGALPAD